MAFFPNSPPKESKMPKVVKGAQKAQGGVQALIQGLRDLEKERDTYKAELEARAQQVSNLCTMCMTLRMVLTRLRKGTFSTEDHIAIAPPLVRKLSSQGTIEGYEYIRSSLSLMRPAIVEIHNERMGLRKEITMIEGAIRGIKLGDDGDEDGTLQGGIQFEDSGRLLEGIEDEDDE